jgi:hypothetical protein
MIEAAFWQAKIFDAWLKMNVPFGSFRKYKTLQRQSPLLNNPNALHVQVGSLEEWTSNQSAS